MFLDPRGCSFVIIQPRNLRYACPGGFVIGKSIPLLVWKSLCKSGASVCTDAAALLTLCYLLFIMDLDSRTGE